MSTIANDTVLGSLVSMVSSIFTLTTVGLRATVTQAVLQDARCALYCALKANGGYSYATLIAWSDELIINSGLNVGLQYWATQIGTITEQEWARRAFIGSTTTSVECETLCDDCIEETDEITDFVFRDSYYGTVVGPANVTYLGNGQYRVFNSQVDGGGGKYFYLARTGSKGYFIGYPAVQYSSNPQANSVAFCPSGSRQGAPNPLETVFIWYAAWTAGTGAGANYADFTASRSDCVMP